MNDFAAIYDTWYPRVVGYAAKLAGREGAEEIANDVFVKIARALDTLQDEARLATWIYAITLNTVRDALRARQRSLTMVELPPEIHDTSRDTPELSAERNEMVACFVEFVRQLPERYYEVYALTELEHLPIESVASRLSITPGAAKIALHRARARLHEQLRQHCRCYTNERGELMAGRKVEDGD